MPISYVTLVVQSVFGFQVGNYNQKVTESLNPDDIGAAGTGQTIGSGCMLASATDRRLSKS
jgi:hypothetical protein